jgi:hypothetical protein
MSNPIEEGRHVGCHLVYLLSDQARHITGQVYSVAGGKIAVWNQPVETRAMYKEGRWSPAEIAEKLPSTVGVERMRLLDRLEEMRRAAAAKEKPNT